MKEAQKINKANMVLVLAEEEAQVSFLKEYLNLMLREGPKPKEIFKLGCYEGWERLGDFLKGIPLQLPLEKLNRILIIANALPSCREKESTWLEQVLPVLKGWAGVKELQVNEGQLLELRLHNGQILTVELFLFPGKKRTWINGSLEEMLWTALRQKGEKNFSLLQRLNYAEEYIKAAKSVGVEEYENLYKQYLYAFFALEPQLSGLKLGQIAALGSFDLKHSRFNGLKKALFK